MNISAFGYNSINNEYSSDKVKDTVKTASFSDKMTKVNEKSEAELNLEYYHSLCKEFPGITFRLEDIKTALELNNSGKEYIGYNGSMHQVGSNFGAIGQCSIEIDIAVIERMRTDPKYEQSVKWHIQFSKERFGEYQTEIPEQLYTFVCIEDNNGKVQTSRGHSSVQPATEEEIKEKMRTSNSKIQQLDSDNMKDNLIDSYLKMIEESEQKRKELAEKTRDNEDVQKTDEVDKRIMEYASNEYSLSFSYEGNNPFSFDNKEIMMA